MQNKEYSLESATVHQAQGEVRWTDRLNQFIREKWILLFAVIFGMYVGLPFLAPILYHVGLNQPASIIQTIYSTQCHQLPDRSFFLFGPQVTYSLPVIQSAFKDTYNPAILRQFVGNAQMGWKVAWSDRMVSMYTSIFFLGLLWWPFRKKVKPLPLWALILFWLPMALDGGTHMLSDILGGIGGGFRYDNLWLAYLTAHKFAQSFYSGNALGSFNSSMRILTGLLFGIGTVWYIFPIIQLSLNFEDAHQRLSTSQPVKNENGTRG